MQINVTYDSSAASAPAGFKAAVDVAVQYLESLITTPITVNIQFGYGTLNGQAVASGDLGESLSNYSTLTYAQVKAALTAAATSADDQAAVATLGADPTGGGKFWVSTAQQKALGIFTGAPGAIDGYVSLGPDSNWNFDPTHVTEGQEYDAIGTLEHEITEVLGRTGFAGELDTNNNHVYGPLDLFRYTAAGVRAVNLTGADTFFSVDGRTMLTQFDSFVAAGGDVGDWGWYSSDDAFDAFAQAGAPLAFTSTDLRVMDVLGYTLKSALQAPVTPATTGSAPPQLTITHDLNIAAGSSLAMTSGAGLTLQYADPGPAPSLDNAGTIYMTASGGVGGPLFSVATAGQGVFRNGQTDVSMYQDAWIRNEATGKIYVLDATNVGANASVYAASGLSGAARSVNIDNEGLIQVVSLNGTAMGFGAGGPGYTVTNGGQVIVWSEKASYGIGADSGATLVNSGSVTATGATAIAVSYGSIGGDNSGSFLNSGVIVATTNKGANQSVGVALVGSMTNTGTIEADIAVQGGSLLNSGSIVGAVETMNAVVNRGVISGEVTLRFGATYDGRHGLQSGGIDVSAGADTVIGGAAGQTVAVFDFASTSATWQQNADGSWTVTTPNAPDTLINVRTLQFTDRTVTLPLTVVQYPDTHDFHGDNLSDILIQAGNGAVVIGETAGTSHQETYQPVGGLGPEWSFRGAGDYLGSGHDQYLIENSSGAVMVGSIADSQTHYAQIGALGPEWRFVETGDFLGEGRSQFLIENTAGAIVVGDVQNGSAHYTQVAALGSEWRFVGAADFLGEHHTEFLIENAAGAVVVGDVQNGPAQYTQVAALGPEWRFVGAADYLGEGHAQFLIESTGGALVIGDVQNGQAHYTQVGSLGPEWTVQGSGDYLGEGHAQFLIENTAGAVVTGDIQGGVAHYLQVGALGSEWSFHP